MALTALDLAILAAYFAACAAVGLAYSRRAGASTRDFFLSGRSLPWWLAGTSMVATTFAADTPLAVSGMVARNGIAGNWLWWNMAFSGLLTTFVFARLWHRAGVMTDAEFAEVRYAGAGALFLRGFRALYLALPVNAIIMGWVTLGMAKVMGMTLGVGKWEAVVVCAVLTLAYSATSGLWGVVVTDLVQFVIAMGGCIYLAVLALDRVGGVAGLQASLPAGAFGLLPDPEAAWMPLPVFLVYLGAAWWASWYPGAEPGGGGYVAQRIFSARSEADGLKATLWFNVAHYALRPWPWILVALSAMALHPDLADKESGFVKVMVDVLPSGGRGLLLAAFAAAYMSTISTHLNWGSSYLVSDVYRRFVAPGRSEAHYVLASRVSTLLLTVVGAVATMSMTTVEGAWRWLIALGAGTGPVYLLRWFWWRINAWSEVAAMLGALLASFVAQALLGLDPADPSGFAKSLLFNVAFTTVVWVSVTLLTRPERGDVLDGFHRRVRPGGFWGPVAARTGVATEPLAPWLLAWLAGVALVYAMLFAIGALVLGQAGRALALLAVAGAAGAVVGRVLRRL